MSEILAGASQQPPPGKPAPRVQAIPAVLQRVAGRAWRTFGPALLILVFQLALFPMPVGNMVSGVIIGMLGALAALGMALIYRSNRILNFAQGDLGALPATLAVLLITLSGVNYFLGFFTGLAGALVLGTLVELLVIRRFFRASRLILTVATLGLSQLLAFAGLFLPRIWGERPRIRTLDPPFAFKLDLAGVVFDANDLLAAIVAPVMLVLLVVFLKRTNVGVAIRASAEKADRAFLLGIPVKRLQTIVWAFATCFAFIGIFLTAGVTSLPFGFALGFSVLLRALASLVIGRMTNLPAIAATAVALGVLENGVFWSQGGTELLDPIVALFIVIALLLQRRGSTRADDDETTSWQAADEVRPVPRELRRVPEVRLVRWVIGAVVGAFVLAFPHFLSTGTGLKAGAIVVFAIIGVSVIILTGWAGQVSLGQMAFVGTGAAVGAVATVNLGLDPILAMPLAGIVGAAVAVIVGLPALRLRGFYLAVTTLAFALAASSSIFNNLIFDKLGMEGIPSNPFDRPELLGRISLDSPTRLYYLALAGLMLAIMAMRGVRSSRTGRVLLALRENERVTQTYGVSVTRAKLVAFATSGFIAAFAGCILVYHQGSFREALFLPEESLAVFTAAVIGGLGTLSGAVYGAVFLRGSQWLLPAPWSLFASALGVLLVLLIIPAGVGGIIYRARDAWLRWVARRRGIVVPSMVADIDVRSSAEAEAGEDEAEAPPPIGAGVEQ